MEQDLQICLVLGAELGVRVPGIWDVPFELVQHLEMIWRGTDTSAKGVDAIGQESDVRRQISPGFCLADGRLQAIQSPECQGTAQAFRRRAFLGEGLDEQDLAALILRQTLIGCPIPCGM
jgi:hypothetical protein